VHDRLSPSGSVAILEHMFEAAWKQWSAADADHYRRESQLLDLPGELDVCAEHRPAPEWTADDDAWLAALVEADPEQAPRRTATDALAEALAGPVSPRLLTELATIDPTKLGDDDRVRYVVVMQRMENYFCAAKVAGVAALAAGYDADGCDGSFLWAEVAAALRLGDGAATALVHDARHLHSMLPETTAAFGRGELTWRKVSSLSGRTMPLNEEQCARVEARVLPRAAQRTPALHDRAVRRAVDLADVEGVEERRQERRREVALVRTPLCDGMAEVSGCLTAEDAETVWSAADAWARRQKAGGDERTLDQLRVAALVWWAEGFLTGRDGEPVPTRHGRPITVNITLDLPTFLGLTDNPGQLLETGALIPAAAIRELIPDAELRRLIIDPTTGHLLDLGRLTYRPSAPLAAFVAMRDVNPTTPTGSLAAAGSGDVDHVIAYDDGGTTERANLHSPNRRWHRAKTLAGWTVRHNDDNSWTWTSPLGFTYVTDPHDYRLGP
jgi:hypothetical protein